MNDSEKRRRELLEQTRELYNERRSIPAVHPRYGTAYRQLYEEDQPMASPGTFGLRVFLCLLLFAAFVAMDKNGSEVMKVDSSRIVEEITYDLDVAEVWKSL
ncbi:hypothetical protein ACQRBN_07980 [Bariatricus sp. SGI.154]|uniref:hypothetical protein n=1 Tax=Bariatricus sp. SGI.154 TaxID=3420549 RepID=UPI003D0314E5